MKNLILTIAANYKYKDLSPLCRSLFSTGYTGDLIIFYQNIPKRDVARLEKLGARLIPFTENSPFLESIDLNVRDFVDFAIHPKTLRYLLYKAFLDRYGSVYQDVLLCDSRDIIFQADPFLGSPLPSGVHCYAEDESQTVGTNRYNSAWIQDAFGEAALERMREFSIVCSGTSMGSVECIKNYLTKMVEQILITKDHGCKDQGIHNFLIRNGCIPNVIIHADDTHRVSTISTFKPLDRVHVNKNDQIIDPFGRVIPIVHQYDRHFGVTWKHNKRLFFAIKLNLLKRFLRVTSSNRLIRKKDLINLKGILFAPMLRNYDWE